MAFDSFFGKKPEQQKPSTSVPTDTAKATTSGADSQTKPNPTTQSAGSGSVNQNAQSSGSPSGVGSTNNQTTASQGSSASATNTDSAKAQGSPVGASNPAASPTTAPAATLSELKKEQTSDETAKKTGEDVKSSDSSVKTGDNPSEKSEKEGAPKDSFGGAESKDSESKDTGAPDQDSTEAVKPKRGRPKKGESEAKKTANVKNKLTEFELLKALEAIENLPTRNPHMIEVEDSEAIERLVESGILHKKLSEDMIPFDALMQAWSESLGINISIRAVQMRYQRYLKENDLEEPESYRSSNK